MANTTEIYSFIKEISPIVQKFAKQYGYHVASPIIAQACLESGYGTSNKAQYHNYFGMKYRPNRCPSSNGTITDGSVDMDKQGNSYNIVDQWFSFANMEDGVQGYFDFVSISNYDKLRERNITDPRTWLETLVECGYANNVNYVDLNLRIITIYNLTQYDNFDSTQKPIENFDIEEEPVIKEEPIIEEEPEVDKLIIGDKIKLNTNRYYNGKKIPSWVRKSTLYFRGYNSNGVIFSTKQFGDITGVVKEEYVSKI